MRRWLPALVVPLVLMTGCVDLPERTAPQPVAEATSTATGAVGPPVEGLGPEGGEQPDEIVRGFLTASASNARSRPAARLYLTPDAARDWADDAAVTVITQDALVPNPRDQQVTLTAQVLGGVDASGVFTGAREELRLVLSLVQVDGEWRIDNPQPGVLLRVEDFRRVYLPYNLYFLDPTQTTVVPDPRWFLSGSVARANTLVEALLNGPSPRLADAVLTELGDGVGLLSNVPDGREVDIDLTGLGARSEVSLQGLSAQLVWTLKQVSVTELTLRGDGQPLVVPGVSEPQSSTDWASYDPDTLSVDDVGHFVSQGALFTDAGTPIAGPAGAGGYGLIAAGVSSGLGVAAGVAPTPDGVDLLLGPYGGELAPVLGAASFTAPSVVSRQQELWTVRDGAEVVRVAFDGTAQTVTVSGLPNTAPIKSLRVSRDGTRVAVVIGGAGSGELYVGNVVRGLSAVTLGGFVQLYTGLRNASDVAWATATQLLFLAVDPADSRTKPWLISIDGGVLTSPPDTNLAGIPTAVAAAPGRPALASSGGLMYRLDGTTWTTLVRGQLLTGSSPSYPS